MNPLVTRHQTHLSLSNITLITTPLRLLNVPPPFDMNNYRFRFNETFHVGAFVTPPAKQTPYDDRCLNFRSDLVSMATRTMILVMLNLRRYITNPSGKKPYTLRPNRVLFVSSNGRRPLRGARLRFSRFSEGRKIRFFSSEPVAQISTLISKLAD